MVFLIVFNVLALDVPTWYTINRSTLGVLQTHCPWLFCDGTLGVDNGTRDEDGPKEVKGDHVVLEEVFDCIQLWFIFCPHEF